MEAQAAYPAELRSAAEARRFAEHTLEAWGCAALVESARLLVSELVVNAVLHAHTEARLSLRYDGSVLHVEVADGSTAVPRRRAYSPTATTGRGLMIVDAVADSWGVEVDAAARSKRVWFDLAMTSAGVESGTAR
jgi:anti-sigma regulatory factor (Ser/Thr protein kinase)